MPTDNDHFLDDIVLMKNPQLTKKILEQTDFRCKSETILIKKSMESFDIDNIRVLIHHGRGWKTRCTIFEREILRLIDSNDLKSAKIFVERLPSWDIIDENFAISLRHLFERGTHEVVRMLLECKIDEYVREKFGMELLVNIFGNSKVKVMELLKIRDFDVNTQDVSGETALHSAVENDIVKNVRFLLDNGANPNAKDCVGWTPLFVVKSVKCMELLLEYGGNLQCIDKDGYTMFDLLETTSIEITKAALANLAVAEAQDTEVREVVRDRIKANETFRNFYKSCHREIEWMREQNDLFTVLCENTKNIADCFSSEEMISLLFERTVAGQGYVHSLLERKLRGALEVVDMRRKAGGVAVEKKVVTNSYEDIEVKIVDSSTFQKLVMFLFIFSSLVLGFYFDDLSRKLYCARQRL